MTLDTAIATKLPMKNGKLALASNCDVESSVLAVEVQTLGETKGYCPEEAAVWGAGDRGVGKLVASNHWDNFDTPGGATANSKAIRQSVGQYQMYVRNPISIKSKHLRYPQSCSSILQNDPTSKDGVYLIDPEQDGRDVRNVWCDMTSNGGGWTLIYSHRDHGENGAKNFQLENTVKVATTATVTPITANSRFASTIVDALDKEYNEIMLSGYKPNGKWVKLLHNANLDASSAISYKPLAIGKFSKVKAVWKDGTISSKCLSETSLYTEITPSQAIASSEASVSFRANKLIDNNHNTRWTSNGVQDGNKEWIRFEFSGREKIVKYKFYTGNYKKSYANFMDFRRHQQY
jgi:hypothetical protein